MAKRTISPETENEEPEVIDVPAGNEENLPVQHRPMGIGEIQGEIDPSSFRAPRLALVYGVGDLSLTFTPGDWVLDKEHLLVNKNETLEFIITGIRLYWKEWLATYVPGELPRIFETEEAALAAGLITRPDWDRGIRSNCSRAIDMNILIKKPEDIACSLFGIELGGDMWAPAQTTFDKTAYRKVGEEIVRLTALSLGGNPLLGLWELHSASEKSKSGNAVISPKVKLQPDRNSQEFINELRGKLGA